MPEVNVRLGRKFVIQVRVPRYSEVVGGGVLLVLIILGIVQVELEILVEPGPWVIVELGRHELLVTV